jgi:acyl phosphate:glycerol-3-phosphate acyltransferase
MLFALSIILAYLLGSIPTAYIAGRLTRGEDIRKLGGGNMGAANAARELGLKVGIIVLVVDIAKGAGAVLIAKALGVPQIWVFLAGFAAVVGHCWPVWLKFWGGKGAATSIGVFLALAPLPFLCAAPIAILVIYFTSNVVLGMAVGFLFSPLFFWILSQPADILIYSVLMFAFLLARDAPTIIKNFRKSGSLRDFLIEKNYKPWQTKRK